MCCCFNGLVDGATSLVGHQTFLLFKAFSFNTSQSVLEEQNCKGLNFIMKSCCFPQPGVNFGNLCITQVPGRYLNISYHVKMNSSPVPICLRKLCMLNS